MYYIIIIIIVVIIIIISDFLTIIYILGLLPSFSSTHKQKWLIKLYMVSFFFHFQCIVSLLA